MFNPAIALRFSVVEGKDGGPEQKRSVEHHGIGDLKK
jgi:hypothetical protein